MKCQTVVVVAVYLITWFVGACQPQEKQMKLFVNQLANQDIAVRRQASKALAEMGPSAKVAVPELIKALGDPDEVVRLNATDALAKMRLTAEEAVSALIQVLQQMKEDNGDIIIAALNWIGPPAGPELIKALRHEDPAVRFYAVKLLPQMNPVPQEAIPALIEAWNSEDFLYGGHRSFSFHFIITEALAQIGSPAIPFLIDILRHKKSPIRHYAVSALGRMDESAQEAVPTLLQMLKEEEALRFSIATALGEIGEPAQDIVPALIAILTDKDTEARRSTALTLGYMAIVHRLKERGEPVQVQQAVPTLIRVLEAQEAPVRQAAVKALEQIGKPVEDIVPALVKALNDENEYVRHDAAESLGNIGQPIAVPALIKALRDKSQWVRDGVIGSLKRIGTPEALQAIKEHKQQN